MKYYTIIGTFTDPCPINETELHKTINAHLEYLDKGFQDGSILVSGPKALGAGGIIIKKVSSEAELTAFIENDPLAIAGAQQYEAIEFKMNDCQRIVREWF